MDRFGFKLAIMSVAVASAAFWLHPPRPTLAIAFGVTSMAWALTALASFFWDKAEKWTYRLSSFFGFLLLTVEGGMGMMGLSQREGILGMALLHAISFVLALVGRYQQAGAGRRRHD